MKYKVLAAEQDAKGIVDVPEDVIMLSGMYHPVTGKFVVACLAPIVESEKEPEEESTEEKKETPEKDE